MIELNSQLLIVIAKFTLIIRLLLRSGKSTDLRCRAVIEA